MQVKDNGELGQKATSPLSHLDATKRPDSIVASDPLVVSQSLSPQAKKLLMELQQSNATEAETYRRIATQFKGDINHEELSKIADAVAEQAQYWERYTGKSLAPNMREAKRYVRIARLFGFTFAMKLLDQHKTKLMHHSQQLSHEIPEIFDMEQKETERDAQLFALLNEKRLSYVGAMILGMNDAIVEITGTLAGLTLAMQNTRLIALSGLITGIAATLSMAASEYLAEKSNGKPDAKRSALYTGVAYFVTVVILLLPYLLLENSLYLLAMGIMLCLVVLILAAFNFYISVAKGVPFKKRFGQMLAISLGVALLSFVLGLAVKVGLGVDV